LLAEGWTVLGLARGAATISHSHYRHVRADLSEQTALETAFAAHLAPAIQSAETLLLVNNAGTLSPIAKVEETSWQQLQQGYALNVIAPAWLTGRAIECTPAGAKIQIVAVSSGAARNPYAGWSTYCGMKAALRMLAQVTAEESALYPEKKIAVLVYEPGVLDTGMQEQIRNADEAQFPLKDKFLSLHREGKLVEPARSARYMLKLLKDLSGFKEARYEG
jgi:NAD(P)-dependent dehydrogenase (short-subunit alcohol dehydrogenase family)